MKSKVRAKNEAIHMRKQGMSYREIQNIIPVSKSTLSNWLKYLELNDAELSFLESRIQMRKDGARLRSSITNRNRRIERERIVFEESSKLFNILISDRFFVAGLCLYWAEGGKKSGTFQFVNSDPEMVTFMIEWIEKFMGVSRGNLKYRLFIHRLYAEEKCEVYWANLIGISSEMFFPTIYKPTIHSIKKNPLYKGCIKIHLDGVYWLRKVMAWHKLFLVYFKNNKLFENAPVAQRIERLASNQEVAGSSPAGRTKLDFEI